MHGKRTGGWRRAVLLLACLAFGAVGSPAWAADRPPSATPAAAGAAPARQSPYTPDRFAGRAGLNYRLIWGVDALSVRLVESGELVRFSYRVLDPAKSRVLNDKQTEAKMDDPKAGVSLVVPTLEKVGQLRQTSTPQAGRSYWMTFSNKGRHVKRGDRVDVVIGPFRANNLVVD
jgi:hypothetical protein